MGLGHRARRASESFVYSSVGAGLFHSAMSGICGVVLTAISWLIVLGAFPFSMVFCLKVVKEYERAVIFRLGRLLPGGARGPGLFFVIPCIDTYRKVDLRVISFDVPPQEILSKDSVTVSVDAVVYFRIQNPVISVTNVNDAFYSTKLLAQTTLRNVLGTKNLSEMLSEREAISQFMSNVLDEATDPWGVKVERVEVKDIRLPQQLMRAMAAEAEAAREARAKVIAAEGEQKASKALKLAADVIGESSAALQLRYLQTLSSIATEHNSTIIFPLPIEVLGGMFHSKSKHNFDPDSDPRLQFDPDPRRHHSLPSTHQDPRDRDRDRRESSIRLSVNRSNSPTPTTTPRGDMDIEKTPLISKTLEEGLTRRDTAADNDYDLSTLTATQL